MECDQPRISQQEFLLAAMKQCGMCRSEFAAHISAGRSALYKWLLPDDSTDFRVLPETGRAYIAQVVRGHELSDDPVLYGGPVFAGHQAVSYSKNFASQQVVCNFDHASGSADDLGWQGPEGVAGKALDQRAEWPHSVRYVGALP
ncbi:hypothetical protein PPGU19_094640 (plasmid) [Paraburkholderia sp. PGU19]|uniref:hypothetical protein n=1 Tax=Paraburkholderia sp. PGU19 TaxID=2735434 RepID=UPI0015DA331F|nr:hypothetical protein [Paraburkholderia sp. PGU19]BCG04896.1 hypothetical protein PPGU19_094640 [Paraburkholderia sp. PGU19]